MRYVGRTVAALAMAGGIAASAVGMADSASAAAGQSYLYRGQQLNAGEQIQRANNIGTVVLTMQGDGNLVEYLYPSDGGAALVCWASNTYETGTANHAIYQQDGNFVVYTAWGKAVWASNTVGGSGQTVDMNANGVLYVGTRAINNGCGY